MAEVTRVPLYRPLTPMQHVAVALTAQGHAPHQAARIAGVGVGTFRNHLLAAAEKIPGDLHPMARVTAWYRGATAAVLGTSEPPPTQRSLQLAGAIKTGEACPACGYLPAHATGLRQDHTRGHARSA